MKPVRLSICIATLNRGAFIGETLQSILSQTTEEVEVIVVDGASTDNTEQVVRGFAEKHPCLRYERLPKKGGVDQDYCKAVDLARGEYVWLFTDDDLLKPGAVAAVLDATQRGYSLIVVDTEVRSVDLAECIVPKRMPLDADRVFAPTAPERDELLATTGVYLSFIGAVVMQREVWNQREKTRYYGTAFIHVGVIFQSPLPGDTLVMARPWITTRYGNAQWVSRKVEIWMFNWPNLIWSFNDFADWAKQRIVPREPWRSYPVLLLERAMGHYCVKDYQQWLAPRIRSPLRKLLTWAIAAAPVGPLNALARFVVRYVLRKAPSIALYDLEGWTRRPRAKA